MSGVGLGRCTRIDGVCGETGETGETAESSEGRSCEFTGDTGESAFGAGLELAICAGEEGTRRE